ncbi:rRNA maturation RNase YbeY [Helicobacter didelphidarum]|uniref:Endoribonuclease YbeY n=2 Tax=Helicobacter didelphidarum TaxID=2040648 RepID=A0A3D8IPM0_9HELI|nr:rRNA maturation RNase YbeY [Helicobacter didelphidarum]
MSFLFDTKALQDWDLFKTQIFLPFIYPKLLQNYKHYNVFNQESHSVTLQEKTTIISDKRQDSQKQIIQLHTKETLNIPIRQQTQKNIKEEFCAYLGFLSAYIFKGFEKKARKDDIFFVELILVNDCNMQQINKEYMQKDYPTDVLSFPLEIFEIPEKQCFGSIVMNFDDVQRKSERFNHNLYAEISILFTHAFLHLLGFDHEQDNGEHRKSENFILQSLNLPTSLIIRNS